MLKGVSKAPCFAAGITTSIAEEYRRHNRGVSGLVALATHTMGRRAFADHGQRVSASQMRAFSRWALPDSRLCGTKIAGSFFEGFLNSYISAVVL